MNLPEKLMSLRKQKGLSQANLAETLNVSRQAISRWEVGTAVPSTDNLKVLSELYEVSVDYLLNDHANDTYKNVEIQNPLRGPLQEDTDKTVVKRSRSIWLFSLIAAIAILAVVITVLIGSCQKQEPANVVPVEKMDTIAEDNYQAETFLLE